eukprot:1738597-Karenia_brevis.AAC.1
MTFRMEMTINPISDTPKLQAHMLRLNNQLLTRAGFCLDRMFHVEMTITPVSDGVNTGAPILQL